MPKNLDSISSEERFYYADGKKVPLVTSNHYVAVRSGSPDAVARLAGASVAESPSAMTVPPQVLDLKEHGLIVVQVANGAGPRGLRFTAPVAVDVVNSFISHSRTSSLVQTCMRPRLQSRRD